MPGSLWALPSLNTHAADRKCRDSRRQRALAFSRRQPRGTSCRRLPCGECGRCSAGPRESRPGQRHVWQLDALTPALERLGNCLFAALERSRRAVMVNDVKVLHDGLASRGLGTARPARPEILERAPGRQEPRSFTAGRVRPVRFSFKSQTAQGGDKGQIRSCTSPAIAGSRHCVLRRPIRSRRAARARSCPSRHPSQCWSESSRRRQR